MSPEPTSPDAALRAEVLRWLRCPVCGAGLDAHGRSLRCGAGHTFDLARQGHVQLTAAPLAHIGDSAAMVAARGRFLAAGHFDPLTSAVRDAAARAWPGGLVLDAGAGTGHHTCAVLDALPDAWGIAVDASKAAARIAARAHPRLAAVVADVWRTLPLADDSVGVLIDVFAPRNAAEFARVLRPVGALVIVTPAADHLAELITTLDLLRVDPEKPARLADAFGAGFRVASSRPYRWIMGIDHDGVGALVGMGPSAWHADADSLAARIATLPDPVSVTASVTVTVLRPRL